MKILGLNAYHGDASAALFVDGELAYAIEEERLNRRKHCAGFPALAARACLDLAGVRPEQLDHVAVSRDPRVHRLHKALHVAERALHGGGLLLVAQVRERLHNHQRVQRVSEALAAALGVAPKHLRAQFHQVEHHRAHLGSAFFASEFAEAAVLSLDGFGDFVSTMWGRGSHSRIEVLGEVRFPHSLGVLYTAVTQWLGFPKYGDEGKVMGLSAYGEPRLLPALRRLLHLHQGGGFSLELRYFRHSRQGVEMTWAAGSPHLGQLYSPALSELLGAPPRAPGEELADLHRDVAASLQALLQEAVLHVCRGLHQKTGLRRLALAGGVALNSVANGKILDHTPFEQLFVQPAAGDNGTAIGAALWVQHQLLGAPRRWVMTHAYTGPEFDEAACAAALREVVGVAPDPTGEALAPAVDTVAADGTPTRAALRISRLDEAAVRARAVDALASGAVLGWFAGRMEFGPRALGHRSILCDPRRADMKELLNRRIKHREAFRPFAPAILAEATADWFVRAAPSPAMLLVDRVRPERRAQIPAVTHHDGTGRLQTVSQADSPQFHALLTAFAERTGVPVLLNTSFNEHEPIVCTPADALRCFLKTRMDALALGPFFLVWAPAEPTVER
jgi:carbamoyltransferase